MNMTRDKGLLDIFIHASDEFLVLLNDLSLDIRLLYDLEVNVLRQYRKVLNKKKFDMIAKSTA